MCPSTFISPTLEVQLLSAASFFHYLSEEITQHYTLVKPSQKPTARVNNYFESRLKKCESRRGPKPFFHHEILPHFHSSSAPQLSGPRLQYTRRGACPTILEFRQIQQTDREHAIPPPESTREFSHRTLRDVPVNGSINIL